MNENEIKIAFFKTNTGKRVMQILEEYKKQTEDIINLSKQLQWYKEAAEKRGPELITPEEEIETRKLMENVTSLFLSKQPKKYEFSIVDENGEVMDIYDIDKLEKEIMAYE